tara:strand:- start:1961 stop:2146 length:186 start_codon:yes stop_codon:yes gene_type:complete
MLTWKPKNKFKPYISVSLNKSYIEEHWSKEAFEKALRKHNVELDRRKSMARLIEENYDILA